MKTQPTNTTENVVLIAVLYDGTCISYVSMSHLDAVSAQILQVIPALVPGVKYTARQLCGEPFWHQPREEDPTDTGRCVAHLVYYKALPLVFAGRTRSNHRLYQLDVTALRDGVRQLYGDARALLREKSEVKT